MGFYTQPLTALALTFYLGLHLIVLNKLTHGAVGEFVQAGTVGYL